MVGCNPQSMNQMCTGKSMERETSNQYCNYITVYMDSVNIVQVINVSKQVLPRDLYIWIVPVHTVDSMT